MPFVPPRRSCRTSTPALLLATSLLALLALLPAAAGAATVTTYPSSLRVAPTGPIPPQRGDGSIALHLALGDVDGAQVVVQGASGAIRAYVDLQSSDAIFATGPLAVQRFLVHHVSFGGQLVGDALLPWSGTAPDAGMAPEQPNQAVYLQVSAPVGTPAGSFHGLLVIADDGGPFARLPLAVDVFNVQLPDAGRASGNLATSFAVASKLYVNTVDRLQHLGGDQQRLKAVNLGLFRFLAEHRVSPQEWGYGDPGAKDRGGYRKSGSWFKDVAGNFVDEATQGAGFGTMRIPVSNQQRARPVGGLNPKQPATWCGYLGKVRKFWRGHGFLAGRTPYSYTLDEPGAAGMKQLQAQARVLHACFPGVQVLVTGNPAPGNRFLWDGGRDDVDVWTVTLRRWYGQFGKRKERVREKLIAKVRTKRRKVWSYVYANGPLTPGLQATEPLANVRMYLLWNALEHADGVLYADGLTTYASTGSPFDALPDGGEHAMVYPGDEASGPVSSLRFEQLRDGIEDWSIYDQLRARRGIGAVRTVLGSAGSGLFSATAGKVQLACTKGCELHSSTAFAWPLWSNDADTPYRIEAAKLQALQLLTS